MEMLIVGALVFVAGLFSQSFLPSYMKTKGENLATHEDLDKLVVQMEATTQATKAIEARISHEVWDRQRQWEMKRDAVIAVIQALGLADDMLLTIGATYESEAKLPAGTPEGWAGQRIELSDQWQATIEEYDRRRFAASFLCGNQLSSALSDVSAHLRSAMSLISHETVTGYTEISIPIQLSIAIALKAARKELGIHADGATSLSNGA